MPGNPPRFDIRSAGDPRLVDQVESERRAAQRIAQTCCSVLDLDLSDHVVTILLVPFMPIELQVGTQSGGENTIVRMVGPDGDAPPLPLSLVVELITRAFGSAEPIVAVGLSGVIAGLSGTGPPVLDLQRALIDQARQSGEDVSTHLASAFAEDSSELTLEIYAAATCFAHHLVTEFGWPAMRVYLQLAGEQRRDEAAIAAFGRPLAQLVREWSANALGKTDVVQPLRGLARHIRGIGRQYRWRFAELMSYVLVGVALTVIMPLTTKYLLDTVLPQRDTRLLAIFIAVLLLVYVYKAVLGLRTAYVSSLLDMRIFFGLQQKMFSHIQRLSHDFHNRTAVGDLMSRMSNDLSQGQQAFSQLAVVPLPAVLNLVAASITIFVLDWRFGVLVLVTVPLLAALYRVMSPRIREASLRQQRAMGSAMGTLQESLAGQSALKANSAESYSERTYASRVNTMFGSGMRMATYSAGMDSAVGFVTSLPLLAVLGLGGHQVIQGSMSLGTLVAILGLLPSVVQPVTELAQLVETVQTSSGSLQRITELLDEPITVQDPADPVPVPPLEESVELHGVSFAYPDGRPAVDSVSLSLPAGTHTAIVGASGSGKSTLLGLLMRFYDPTSGVVMIDGVDVRDVSLADLRGRVGLVSQETVLFDATLRENIALGRPGVTDGHIAAAVDAASLGEFVRSLPEGLDTLMGERASRLSGGQKQRVGIARALLRDPALLLLDEPTSALDRDVEQQVLATLATARAGRTTVTVTHRVDTVAQADLIVVMTEGRIVESGQHQQLITAGGAYAQLLSHGQDDLGRGRRLAAVSLFADAPFDALEELEEHLRHERFAPGQRVVTEGEEAEALYIVESGRAEVTSGPAPYSRRLRVLGSGDTFGELALAGVPTRTATVTALDDLQVGMLSMSDFHKVAAERTDLDLAVRRATAERRAVYTEVEHA